MLNVKISTNNYAVYNELGRYPLIIERHVRIVKYWFSLLHKSRKNCVLNAVYVSMEQICKVTTKIFYGFQSSKIF